VCREDVGHAGLVDNLVVLDLLAAHQLESARYAAITCAWRVRYQMACPVLNTETDLACRC